MAKTRNRTKPTPPKERPIPVPQHARATIERKLSLAQSTRQDFENYVQAVADVVEIKPGWKLDTNTEPMSFVPPDAETID